MTVKALETFLEVILWKPFQLFRRIRNVSSITKAPSLQCWYQPKEQVKISCSQVRRVWGMLQCCHTVFFSKKSWPIDRCAGALSWRRIQLLVLQFFGAFPSNRIFKATKRVNVYFFSHKSNSSNRNEYQVSLLWGGGKFGCYEGLTTLLLSSADCLDIMGDSSWSPKGLSKPVMGIYSRVVLRGS